MSSPRVCAFAVQMLATIILWLGLNAPVQADANPPISLQVRDTELSEVIEMIARQQQVNILMSGNVSGSVSISLYDTPLREALTSIANAAGYALEKRGKSYFVVPHDQVGSYKNGHLTSVRVYDIDYVDGQILQTMLNDHLSLYGKATFIPERSVLVVRDQPEFLYQIDKLMRKVDQRPRQVMIEAKILEVSLNEDEQLGIDWTNLFNSNGGDGSFGVSGNGSVGQGFFFDLVTPDVEVAISAMQEEGRIHTLSTPKLVALEDQEAAVVIGDRRGFQVTTTINQVTTESIEFLESGVILRVTVSIDAEGKILMQVHPEVSTGTVDANGIPSQTTTEVTTNVIVPSGETIFIGGLIKKSENLSRTSVPGVNRVPIVRRLFSGKEKTLLTTETIVLIRPIIADDLGAPWNKQAIDNAAEIEIEAPYLEPWTTIPQQGTDIGIEPVMGAEPNIGAEPLNSAKSEQPESKSSQLEASVQTQTNSVTSAASRQHCDIDEIKFCYDDGCQCETPP